MKVVITGAAGFLGRRLAGVLLGGVSGLPRVTRLIAVDTASGEAEDPRVEWHAGTVADPAFVGGIIDDRVGLIFHMAAVLSGQSEAEFDAGLRVNVDGTRALLERCRTVGHYPRFVFTSTVAVFGAPLPEVVPEDMAVRPQSSYGAEKAIAEILVNEYSRRGFVDGRVARLPTVAVRPGRPNSALSSFVSGIIREPLAGVEAVCPVPLDVPLWISSPGTVTQNLVHAARLPREALADGATVNLPGLSVTPAQMLDSLERVAGAEVRARVRCVPDERVMRVVCTWPAAFDVRRALHLGFAVDRDVDSLVREFIDEHHAGRTRS